MKENKVEKLRCIYKLVLSQSEVARRIYTEILVTSSGHNDTICSGNYCKTRPTSRGSCGANNSILLKHCEIVDRLADRPLQLNLSLVVRKPVFGVSDQVRHKPGCEPQKMARDFKFRIYAVEGLYYP